MHVEVHVNGKQCELGSAKGDGCNCLIDSLRQLLPVGPVSLAEVRRQLEKKHRNRNTEIAPGDYLELDRWDDIINLLARNSALRKGEKTDWASQWTVVCIDLAHLGHGEVFPRGTAGSSRRRLHLARVNENHFIPMHPLRARRPTGVATSLPAPEGAAENSRGSVGEDSRSARAECQAMLSVRGKKEDTE